MGYLWKKTFLSALKKNLEDSVVARKAKVKPRKSTIDHTSSTVVSNNWTGRPWASRKKHGLALTTTNDFGVPTHVCTSQRLAICFKWTEYEMPWTDSSGTMVDRSDLMGIHIDLMGIQSYATASLFLHSLFKTLFTPK